MPLQKIIPEPTTPTTVAAETEVGLATEILTVADATDVM